MKHLSPPRLFSGDPSYRLLDVSLAAGRCEFGMGAYFDKIDICEALTHEAAAVCLEEGMAGSPERLRGRLPFRDVVGDPFDLRRRAVIPRLPR
ncbi:MAG: hypothetical protein ACRDTC_15785 [Pseudonocardiaceae bacterium]